MSAPLTRQRAADGSRKPNAKRYCSPRSRTAGLVPAADPRAVTRLRCPRSEHAPSTSGIPLGETSFGLLGARLGPAAVPVGSRVAAPSPVRDAVPNAGDSFDHVGVAEFAAQPADGDLHRFGEGVGVF